MSAYYNEIDPFAAAWLRNLITAGLIAPGEVDERDIRDVKAGDLAGYTQCHFFAGIGGWSYALRLAGWDDARPVWSGSCPCQPFSSAGQGKAADDERHLWPGWFSLIRECRPRVVFGEQVEAAIGWGWLDAVFADMEAEGYACGATVLPACGVGAPHIRQRLWFVAQSTRAGLSSESQGQLRRQLSDGLGQRSQVGLMADTTRRNQWGHGGDARSAPDASKGQAWPADGDASGSAGAMGRLEHAASEQVGLSGRARQPGDAAGELADTRHNDGTARTSWSKQQPTPPIGEGAGSNRPWSNLEWLPCRDGKWRPTLARLQFISDGLSARMEPVRSDQIAQEKIDAKKGVAGSAQALRGLRAADVSAKVQRSAGEQSSLSSSSLLQPDLHGGWDDGSHQGGEQSQQQEAGSKDRQAGVRDMRPSEQPVARSSSRRQSDEQLSIEFTDFVRLLPQAGAFAELCGDARTAQAVQVMLQACGADRALFHSPYSTEEIRRCFVEQNQDRLRVAFDSGRWIVVPLSPLLASNISAQVGKLRAAGNAIVPEAAAAFIGAYVEARAA